MSWIAYIIALFLFLLLIVSHEFGHFATAKLCGIKVNEFSVGMGPLNWQRSRGETEYSLRALPIGGYCKLEGENGDSDDERSFSRAKWWKKVIILAAGAFMNIVLALLIMTLLYTWAGSLTTTIDTVVDGSPAYEAGVMPGDSILAVNGVKTPEWSDVINNINLAGDEAVLTVKRGSETIDITSSTYINSDGRNVIGITSRIRHSVVDAFSYSLAVTGDFMLSMRDFFVQLFTGKASSDDVVGVVGMVSMIGETAKVGIANVIFLMCIISLNLGIVNLLPLPALDGGRILFVFIRALFRGKISDEAEGYVHAAGMVLLMGLMLFLVFNDTLRLFGR